MACASRSITALSARGSSATSSNSSSEVDYMVGIVMPTTADESPLLQQYEYRIRFDNMDALETHVCVTCCGSFCVPCMPQFVEFKILDGEVSRKKLVRPAPECEEPLSKELIATFATSKMFVKYQSFMMNQKIGVRFYPRAECSAATDKSLFCHKRKVHCNSCSTESCMCCGGGYHCMRLCRRDDKRYSKWLRSHEVRACSGCKTDIEKQGGCLRISCVRCDQEFC